MYNLQVCLSPLFSLSPASLFAYNLQVCLSPFTTREQVLAQQLNELRAMVQSIMATKASLVATLDNCPHKQHLSEAADKTRMLVRKLSEQVEAMLCSVDRNRPLDEVMSKLKQFKEQSQNALDFVNSLTGEWN